MGRWQGAGVGRGSKRGAQAPGQCQARSAVCSPRAAHGAATSARHRPGRSRPVAYLVIFYCLHCFLGFAIAPAGGQPGDPPTGLGCRHAGSAGPWRVMKHACVNVPTDWKHWVQSVASPCGVRRVRRRWLQRGGSQPMRPERPAPTHHCVFSCCCSAGAFMKSTVFCVVYPVASRSSSVTLFCFLGGTSCSGSSDASASESEGSDSPARASMMFFFAIRARYGQGAGRSTAKRNARHLDHGHALADVHKNCCSFAPRDQSGQRGCQVPHGSWRAQGGLATCSIAHEQAL